MCNHPELFERADVVAPFAFCEFGRTGSIAREGDFVTCQYSTRSLIEYQVPELLHLDGGLVSVPHEKLPPQYSDTGILHNLLSIWSTDWMKRSLEEDGALLLHSHLILNMLTNSMFIRTLAIQLLANT